MFLIQQPEFLIREFSLSDFNQLLHIAHAINVQAKNKEGFQPFYAFQLDPSTPHYDKLLQQKIKAFLQTAQNEKLETPRKTYRLALCDDKGELIGNITIDNLPSHDESGNKIQGDIGYFINPHHGRKGLMSKALRSVLTIYFNNHEELDVTVHPMNLYSIKMLQRFNAKVVGLKTISTYQNEPRIVLKISKENFLSSCQPCHITTQKKQVFSNINEREKNV